MHTVEQCITSITYYNTNVKHSSTSKVVSLEWSKIKSMVCWSPVSQSVSQSVWCCLTLSHSSDNDIQYEVSNWTSKRLIARNYSMLCYLNLDLGKITAIYKYILFEIFGKIFNSCQTCVSQPVSSVTQSKFSWRRVVILPFFV